MIKINPPTIKKMNAGSNNTPIDKSLIRVNVSFSILNKNLFLFEKFILIFSYFYNIPCVNPNTKYSKSNKLKKEVIRILHIFW